MIARCIGRAACEAELDFHYAIRGIYLSGRIYNRDVRSSFLFNDQARGQVACLFPSYLPSPMYSGTFRLNHLFCSPSLEQVGRLYILQQPQMIVTVLGPIHVVISVDCPFVGPLISVKCLVRKQMGDAALAGCSVFKVFSSASASVVSCKGQCLG